MTPKTFIIMGHSGSGKGTQAKLLKEYLEKNNADGKSMVYIETGATFREFVEQPGYTNSISNTIMQEGGRQPDFLAIWNWADMLVKNMKEETHLIFDGAPRSLPEAETLDTAISFYKRKEVHILFLNVSTETAKKRIELRARKYDLNPGEEEAKIEWFNKEVLPAVDFFRSNKDYSFLEINGDQEIEKIHQDIISSLT